MKTKTVKTALSIILGCTVTIGTLSSCQEKNEEKPVEPYLFVSPSELEFDELGGTLELKINTESAWTASISGEGFSIDPAAGESKATITVTAAPAATLDATAGSITVKSGSLSKEVKLSRDGKNPDRVALTAIYNALGGAEAGLPDWEHEDYSHGDMWVHVEKGRVTKIWLSQNSPYKMKGEIPDEVGLLSELEEFHLFAPDVTGTLPQGFSRLTNLKKIYIYNTQMESLPDVFNDMHNLEEVRIRNNQKMAGPLPPSLGKSEALKEMFIQMNAFTGSVPVEWCLNDKKIDVGLNRLTSFPPEFYQMPSGGYNFKQSIEQQNEDGSFYHIDISNAPNIQGYFPIGGTVTDLDGSRYTFKDVITANKYTVELWWGTWCPNSKPMLQILKKYYEKYHDKGLEIIALAASETSHYSISDKEANALVREHIKANGYDAWKNVEITESNLSYYPMEVPSAAVYDRDGNILFSWRPIPDPTFNRFDKTASSELIPFLESLLGPLDEEEGYYESTDFSKDGEVMILQQASVGNGIDIVFMGDGYTDKDMVAGGLYEQMMKESMEQFFTIEPYKSFRDRFNVYAVKAVSRNGKIGNGYETALGTVHGKGQYLGGNTAKCYDYAMKVPSIDSREDLLIGVLVNTIYSGGTTFVTYPTNSSVAFYSSLGNEGELFGPVLRHEACGHGFGHLADEYVAVTGSPSSSEIEEKNAQYRGKGWWANIDFTKDASKIRWSHMLSDSRYSSLVGIYEGGNLYSKGVYRPTEDSMMNQNVEYFNAPSREAIYKRIMTLSGESYSLDKFFEYDAVNRSAK